MDEKCNGSAERKTLIGALENLEGRLNQVRELAMSSHRLLDKMNRVDDKPKESNGSKIPATTIEKSQNIIELFETKSEKLGELINTIGNNIGIVTSMID